MFWDDIKEIKEWMNRLTDRLMRIDHSVEHLAGKAQENAEMYIAFENIKECIEDALCSEDEFNTFNRIHDKLNTLVDDANRQQAVLLAEKTLDKFEDYMKNVDKLNVMINEFKGCVSLAQSAIAERKQLEVDIMEMKKVADISKDIYKAMLSFVDASKNIHNHAHFKIDAIYRALCEEKPKSKAKPKKRAVKKSAPIPSP